MIIYRPRDTVISPFLTLDSPEQVSYDLRKIDLNNLAMQCNPCLSNLYDMWLLMLEQPMYLTVFVSDWFLCLKHLASSCDWKKLEMNMNWNKRSIYQSHSTVLCYEVLIRRSLWTRVWLLPQYLLCEDQMTQRFCIFWLAIKSYFIWLCYVKLIDRIDWNKCTKICWFWKFQIDFPDW